MGYVIFASRKVALTNRLNMLQLQLQEIENQKLNLLNYSAAVADGVVSSDEWAENTGCFNALGAFEINAFEGNAVNQNRAKESAGEAAAKYQEETDVEPDDATQDEFFQTARENVMADYAMNVENKRIAAIENQLDLQMKRIESKITATQSELQSVEQAETKAIESATPKYAGLG